MDKIIETKTCKQCSQSFDITQDDRNFYDKISPSFGGKKIQIPTPTLCPNCRRQRRLSFRNERNLYRRKCDATGKEIISMYSPDKELIVYNQDFWWSDAWKLEMNSSEYDFSKSFFEQFQTLNISVPKRAFIRGTGSENCEYTNLIGASKNCYFAFNGMNNEDSLYVNEMSDISNCVDCSQIQTSEYCYQCISLKQCYKCFFSQECLGCRNSQFLYNCNNCEFCFGCVNLEGKSYHIHNKKYSKQEYFSEVQKLLDSGYCQEDFHSFSKEFPKRNVIIVNSENALGNRIYNSKNIYKGLNIYDAENIRYGVNVYNGAHDCMDVEVCLNDSGYLYEMSLANKNSHHMLFCHDCWNACENLIYCTECKKTKDCFGCSGLVDKQYCILNKQYTKEQYEKLVPQIIEHMQKSGEWGEFFPMEISPFGYNETVAYEFYPTSKEQVLAYGATWSDYEPESPKVEKILSADMIPKNISDVPDEILNWAIECEVTQKPFRIIEQELAFYRLHSISIPSRHPDQRYQDRIELRTPHKTYDRLCDSCQCDIVTSHSPERPEIVYCENCYNKEIYG